MQNEQKKVVEYPQAPDNIPFETDQNVEEDK